MEVSTRDSVPQSNISVKDTVCVELSRHENNPWSLHGGSKMWMSDLMGVRNVIRRTFSLIIAIQKLESIKSLLSRASVTGRKIKHHSQVCGRFFELCQGWGMRSWQYPPDANDYYSIYIQISFVALFSRWSSIVQVIYVLFLFK